MVRCKLELFVVRTRKPELRLEGAGKAGSS